MSIARSETHDGYRPDIDGLRAVAVLSVVAYHAFPNLVKGGFVGVDIFFVISGFLISGIIFRALETGSFSYLEFYRRRIRRIFPALVTVCAASFAVGWYVLLPDEFAHLGKQMAAGAGFVSNFALWSESGYFDAAAETKPLLHLWSLAIEEQFYIVWPIILSLLWRRRHGFIVTTLLIALISFAINVLTVHQDPVAAFYSPLSRFWELMVGGALAYIALHHPGTLQRFGLIRALLGLFMIGLSIALLTKESAFPGYWVLLPTFGAALLISAGANPWVNSRLLAAKPMVWIGRISYPLYLWHWPILVFAKIVKGKVLTPTDRMGAVAAAFVLAYLTYRFIELKLRHSDDKRTPFALSGALAFLGCIGLLTLPGTITSRLRGDNITQVLAAAYDWEFPPTAAELHSAGALRYAAIANRAERNTLFLGDSNMEQYGPRIDRVIKEHPGRSNGAILIGNQRTCSVLKELFSPAHACDDALNAVRELVASPSTRDVVIVASWLNFATDLKDASARQSMAAFIRSFSTRKKVFIVLNIPTGNELAPTSMFVGSRLGHLQLKPLESVRFDRKAFDLRMQPVRAELAQIASDGGAVLIDPVEHLCGPDSCPVFGADGSPLYLDGGHITRTYSKRAAQYIDPTLEPTTAELGKPETAVSP